MISTRIGESIPPNTKHAVSVCLPTWEATVGYEEGKPEIINALTTGYPRFFIHKAIQRLCQVLTDKYAKENEACLCFPSYEVAKRCREYIVVKSSIDGNVPKVRILQLATSKPVTAEETKWKRECKVAVVFVDKQFWPLMKQYWQHSGEILSSRLAEYVLYELFIVEKSSKTRQNNLSSEEARDEEEYIEQRFGRNLDFSYADTAKSLIKRRIATKVVDGEAELHEERQSTTEQFVEHVVDAEEVAPGVALTIPAEPSHRTGETGGTLHVSPEEDVYLFPSGMASIFTAHRLLLQLDAQRVNRSRLGHTPTQSVISSPSQRAIVGYGPPYKKTVMFGFPYTDTLSILEKFNHTYFLGQGDSTSMDKLKEILHSGEQILAVFMEAPSNPLLKMGDLLELKELANSYGFYIVVDETAGGFVNIDVLPHADIVCSSLTKIFSGDSNVIAGSVVLNPRSKLYPFAQTFMQQSYEDCLWCEDALCLERNSRDFVARTLKVNHNTERLLEKVLLPQEGKLFKKIYYPSTTSPETKRNYDAVRCQDGGYGGLFSLTFFSEKAAKVFFNSLQLCKGPSLGTNFTLACPYAIIAHYQELDRVAQYGVESNLVRVSVGLEPEEQLCKVFQTAVEASKNI
ncbi:STR2 (YJR130C) and YML082W [Zygosaccharomyces parabailii]|uniref:cystathionine gamma-synthase n=1 Tax=Zygosaccharomyces bailii (strain CLIB 213 / ATCC 58445 / CBS 680 / BCRC 21525 / NBRC 1098 / NCYC 1416 / NRRL Y-2227) TaxID=1333698 RepID=A0A8J2TAH3_ZYGB2|nr:STR2 (YJR130C) and YML082W [Zygosaccharomyces parabailii]CDF91314.1 ZYBA0S10-04522g1_1 [Zygosaccharomyces bailii CLIB 213]CDH17084.1 probable Cystathionine gamma-synthase [Zygosaccharomyces bailii ISA1307]SJM88345.1 probable Cystathionine gamma-synthase [Zygosaccharomyces bailii]